MLRSGGMADRRGLRPCLLFKPIPGGKGAGPGTRNWMLSSGGMADKRGLLPRLRFKATPGGKGADTGKRNWMLCSGWMDDRPGLRPRLLVKTTSGGRGAGTVGFKVRAWDPGARFRVKDSASGSDQGSGLKVRAWDSGLRLSFQLLTRALRSLSAALAIPGLLPPSWERSWER
jgi:hypothetical protein